jgi:predicted Zn-dependent peptidase
LYDLRQSDNLEANIAESLDKILYQGNGLARSVIGKKTDIENFSLQDAKALHSKTHFPENAVLIVVGDVSAHELMKVLPKVVAQKLPIGGGAEFILKNEDIPKSVTFSGNSLNEKLVWRRVIELPISLNYDLLAIQCDLLKDILSADLPGGLAKPLRFDAFVTSSFEITVSAIDERHVELRFVGVPDKNVQLEDVQKAFETELVKSAERGIPADTFERILTRYLKDLPYEDNEIAVSEWTEKYVLERISSQRIPMAIASLQNLRKDLTKPAIDTLLHQLAGKGRTAIAFVRKEGAPE